MHFFTLFEKIVKMKVFDSFFLARTASFFRFHQNKKSLENLNYFQQLFFYTFSHPMNKIFLVLVLIIKIKIGDTQKSAANDANILVGCISNPKNIYFEVCMVR